MKAGASNFFQSGIRFSCGRFLRPVLSFFLGGENTIGQKCAGFDYAVFWRGWRIWNEGRKGGRDKKIKR